MLQQINTIFALDLPLSLSLIEEQYRLKESLTSAKQLFH